MSSQRKKYGFRGDDVPYHGWGYRVYGEYGGPTPDPIPEPGTMALLGIGLAGLGLYGYRRRGRA